MLYLNHSMRSSFGADASGPSCKVPVYTQLKIGHGAEVVEPQNARASMSTVPFQCVCWSESM